MGVNEWRTLGFALGVSLGILVGAQAQSLTWLGVLEGDAWSYATGVSDDGTEVSGVSVRDLVDPGAYRVAFRWTLGIGLQSLEHSAGATRTQGISGNGTIIVGGLTEGSEARAFYWNGLDVHDLGNLGGVYTMAFDASRDGSVIVGISTTDRSYVRGVQWTGFTPTDLGTLGGLESSALGVSADGTVVVGWATDPSQIQKAVRWTSSGIQDLGIIGYATKASADGSVVAGVRDDGVNRLAFRWTTSSVLYLTLGGNTCFAHDVSDDGNVIVGFANLPDDSATAFRWVSGVGMQNLNEVYADLLTDGSFLSEARGISGNGRYIVGFGSNGATGRTEAFLLNTCTEHNGDVDRNNCVDDADLLAVLFAFGQTGAHLGRVDTNCDQVVDDADLLTVLFSFGTGC